MNMDGVEEPVRKHDGAVTPWQFVGEGGRGWFSQRGPSVRDFAPPVCEVGSC